jgi:long-chain fatty acid transport protein
VQQLHAGGGFSVSAQGAYALGSAFAGAAAGSAGLPSMYFNPATITDNPGWQSSIGLTGVLPYANITPQSGTDPLVLPLGGTGNEARDAIIPNFYSSYQITDSAWLGLSVNAPFGLTTEAANTSASQIYGRDSEVISFEVSPVLGIRINDWLSIGAAVRAQYFKGSLTAANTPFPGSPGNDLTADSFALGYALGVTLTPFEGTRIGVGYRSSVTQDIDGDLTLDGPLGMLPAGRYPIESSVTLPDILTVGLEQRLSDRFKLLVGYEYTHWSSFDSFPVYFTSGPGAGTAFTSLAFKYDDAHYFSIGGEYEWSPDLTLVAGVGYQISPISDEVRSVRLPESDTFWLAVGARYSLNSKLSLDLSYAHAFPVSAEVDISSPANPAYLGLDYVGSVDAHADLISIGINYRWN